MYLPKTIQKAIEAFNTLPGIGSKTSERFVFYLLHQSKPQLADFASAIASLKDRVTLCERCFNYSDQHPCHVCSDPKRDPQLLCVVAESVDIIALERSHVFRGLYHVLGGLVDPLHGIEPEHLRIRELLSRVMTEGIQEVILAMNPTVEGETSALYLQKLLKQSPIKITRLAKGLPTGSNIEYADELTLASAFEGRRVIH
ncbi:MAG: recombination protein RecR [Candidatus Kerfeldbacteria bacterium RIFCSPHIGHO2_02_FULL_42_14]|uniref:Recombination protein RecR n=1 Tax=Candidatus Kerfeldbacteria bacterium RIFCSPHIGHO2_02_FULL_42_14 TaxID=1798540 RepID=A0A1G2ARS0_9BACT|nr:MAG: recombination protein RecR [Candidatus Kerfeldbacteria bacterium RIFCSPHIGHO2_02_FULL_42_14]OGY80405.1 MAG: recombination protein RecR [Candidatus Kerfeldbacteria bacterium RIFCSPHIGHO2_12_FULL_42_13]OGY83834.1 MAG: recombination protein RecR [Candidatus Kerfeldbacteria bacterium RIFCSPLOWO2_02_FULL_42_19]OGY85321.1 MAG: recombination protein RecR [Candidatus Kerfeldbacteria bacterium RIFCSPLOWO2_12_FULL_43_9]